MSQTVAQQKLYQELKPLLEQERKEHLWSIGFDIEQAENYLRAMFG